MPRRPAPRQARPCSTLRGPCPQTGRTSRRARSPPHRPGPGPLHRARRSEGRSSRSFPFGSPSLALSASTDTDATTGGEWAGFGRPVCGSVGVDIEVDMEERRDARVVTADLISRARAGDGEAFGRLVEPYRRELQVHCYRMLGSFQDAEDALQDALLAAWHGLAGFEGRASFRTWLYRIATNRCLDGLRAASRRPAKEWDVP